MCTMKRISSPGFNVSPSVAHTDHVIAAYTSLSPLWPHESNGKPYLSLRSLLLWSIYLSEMLPGEGQLPHLNVPFLFPFSS